MKSLFLLPLSGLVFVLGLLGCAASTPPPNANAPIYVRAQAAPEPPPPPPKIVQTPPPAVLPGQLKHVPVPHLAAAGPEGGSMAGKNGAAKPQQAVQAANLEAAQKPDKDGFFNAILSYPYEPGALYQVYASPMRVTDIRLEPGEKLVGQPASGDVVRWVLALGKSIDDGHEQLHVYVKPTRGDLETNLAINTDRRSYMLELHSYADVYMAAVQWQYPHDQIARLEAEQQQATAAARDAAPVVRLENLNFSYSIRVTAGHPAWTPIQVFDDGRRTFVRFPEAMLVREAPALFVLRDKQTQLVNYRVRRNLYVVDRLLDAAELRVGQQDQEVVRIERTFATPSRHDSDSDSPTELP